MIIDNLKTIQAALKKTGVKNPPQLIAVSKQQSDEAIDEALSCGLRVFGENRVQEAEQHWTARRALYPELQLHLIGPLQRNKVAAAVRLFDVIQTIDRVSLIDELAHEVEKQQKNISFFIQVNTGNEPQKAGVDPAQLHEILSYAKNKNLNVTGLMCIPPVNEATGIHFTFLKKLADRYGLKNLSMGMSDDFVTATLSGATHIRIGSSLFGARII